MKKTALLFIGLAFLASAANHCPRNMSCCAISIKALSVSATPGSQAQLSRHIPKCSCCRIQAASPAAMVTTLSPAHAQSDAAIAVSNDFSLQPAQREIIALPHMQSPPGRTLARTVSSRAPPSLA